MVNAKVIIEVPRQDEPRITQFVGTWESDAIDEVRADLEGCGGEWAAGTRWEVPAEYDGGDPSVGQAAVGHVLQFDAGRQLPVLPEDHEDWGAAGGEVIGQVVPLLQNVCARHFQASELLKAVFDFRRWRVRETAPGTVRTERAWIVDDEPGEQPLFVVITPTHPHPEARPQPGWYHLEIISNEHGCELLDLQVKDGALTVLVEDL